VARRFRGESENKVDAKGRVSVPVAFRRVLEEGDPDWTNGLNPNLVLVYGGKSRNFIEGYTMTEMENVEDRISEMKKGTRERRLLEHMFSSQTVQVQVDETGRLVLSQKLRDKLGITKQAMFVATVDTFQIWEPSAYAAQAERFESWVEDEDEDFDPLILLDSPQPEE